MAKDTPEDTATSGEQVNEPVDQPSNEDTQAPEAAREDGKTVSEGPGSLSKGETTAGGADAVPDAHG